MSQYSYLDLYFFMFFHFVLERCLHPSTSRLLLTKYQQIHQVKHIQDNPIALWSNGGNSSHL